MLRNLTVLVIATTLACGGQGPSGPADVPSGPSGPTEVPAPDGYLWRLLTKAAEWPPERGLNHTFSFGDHIWLMDDRVGDWRTEDGSAWTTFSPSVPARGFGHEILPFGGRLVGLRRDGATDELWGSQDGETWSRIGEGPPLTSSGHTAVVFRDQLWLFRADRIEEPYAWATSNGVQWTQAATPPWGPRGDFRLVVYDGRLWAIGGRRSVNRNPDDLVAVNDSWVTADGVTWERRGWDLDWPFRLYYGVAAWDGKLWLIGGGEGGDDGERNDVWTSTDGAHWELFEAEAPWTGRFAMSTVIHRDRLFMFAGKEGREEFLNDVWSLERSGR
jgi:hypothetical protein